MKTPALILVSAALSVRWGLAALVTTTADSGPGSLRQAIASAASGETVTFAVSGLITLTSGELAIDRDLTILGPGANNLVIQRSFAPGTPGFGIFNVASATVIISGLTVSNGRDAVGGGIYNQGNLTLNDCVISGNFATGGGGGILNLYIITISNCVIRGNSAVGETTGDGFGGGFYNDGTATTINCAISNNSVTGRMGGGYGGGIYNDGTLTLTSSVIKDNSAAGGPDNGGAIGGGINNGFGTVSLNDSTVSGNVARGGAGSDGGPGEGGGVANDFGTVTLDRSTVSGNFAVGGNGGSGGPGEGGGVANDFGTVTLDRSTVSGNSAVGGNGGSGGPGEGGGVVNDSGTVYVFNSTVSGNVARGGAGAAGVGSPHGGGVFNGVGSLIVTHSTIAANVVPAGFLEDGGGLFNFEGAVLLKNTIVAANRAAVDLVNGEFGDIFSDGFNLAGSASGLIVPGPSDQFNLTAAALRLGPLQNNGGPTFTHALLCGSPAIDAGDNTDAPATDQRGFLRIVGGVIDIGAYEYNNAAPTVLCPGSTNLVANSSAGILATVSATVADADGDPLAVVWTVDGTLYQTNLVAAGGRGTIAQVDFTAIFGVGSHLITVSVSDPSECLVSCSTTVLVRSGTAQACELYPIALHEKSLAGVPIGGVINDIYNGIQPGNFGWLTWAGSPSEPTLARSLTPPGNSGTYFNPAAPNDHTVSVGDWVQGKPGVSNGSRVRAALDALKQIDITVPVWNQTRGTGNNSLYRVGAFARVRLVSYHLPRENRISARFLGFVSCN